MAPYYAIRVYYISLNLQVTVGDVESAPSSGFGVYRCLVQTSSGRFLSNGAHVTLAC